MKGEAGNNVRVAIAEAGPGRVTVRGELTFATARHARSTGLRVLEGLRGERILVDCAQVSRADSAGLAVLLEWLAWGRRCNRVVQLDNLPPSLVAIARISELDQLLSAAG